MVDISNSIKSLLEQGVPEQAILRLCKNSIRDRFEHEIGITSKTMAGSTVLGGTSLGCFLALGLDIGNEFQRLALPPEALVGLGAVSLAGGAIMGYIAHKHNKKAKACVELTNSINTIDDVQNKYLDGNFESYITNFNKTRTTEEMSL